MQTFNYTHPLFQQNTADLDNWLKFEEKINGLAGILKINLADFEIDHLAIRTNKLEEAQEWLTLLLKYGIILSDNIVNGRPIYLIELNDPLFFAQRKVSIIELPFPKGKMYPSVGWEHIEIVVPFLTNEKTEHWLKRVMEKFALQDLSNIQIKVSQPKVDGEQLANPSIALSLLDKTQNETCIKIHPYNIKKVIEV